MMRNYCTDWTEYSPCWTQQRFPGANAVPLLQADPVVREQGPPHLILGRQEMDHTCDSGTLIDTLVPLKQSRSPQILKQKRKNCSPNKRKINKRKHELPNGNFQPMGWLWSVVEKNRVAWAKLFNLVNMEWVAIPFLGGSSQSRGWTWVSCVAGGFFTIWATMEAQFNLTNHNSFPKKKKKRDMGMLSVPSLIEN